MDAAHEAYATSATPIRGIRSIAVPPLLVRGTGIAAAGVTILAPVRVHLTIATIGAPARFSTAGACRLRMRCQSWI